MYEICEGIWGVDGDVLMGLGLHFPVRMLVFRLGDGSLLLHSPVALDDETEAALRAKGEVKYVIAPNLLHHLFVKKALARFPEAQLYGAPGFAKKRPDLPFVAYLEDGATYPWSDELEHLLIKGVPDVNECVFFHRASGSLVVTDLIFHLHTSHNFQTYLMYTMAGVYKKLAQSRLLRLFTKDKAASRESILKLLQWDARRLLMAHGELFEGDVRGALQHALRWLDVAALPSGAKQPEQP